MKRTRYPPPDELLAKAGRSVRLARARRAKGQNVVAGFQPRVAFSQGHEMGLAEAGHQGEVEAIEGLAGRQAGLGKMALDAALFTFGQFQFCECGEQAGGWPAFLVGARAEVGPEPCDGGQAQGGEQRGQLGKCRRRCSCGHLLRYEQRVIGRCWRYVDGHIVGRRLRRWNLACRSWRSGILPASRRVVRGGCQIGLASLIMRPATAVRP